MLSTNKRAFTLIEIIVVLGIVAFVMAIISPRLFRKKDQVKVETIFREFNNLLSIARQEAVSNQKICRLRIKAYKNLPVVVSIEEMEVDPEKENKLISKTIFSEYLKTEYILPQNIKIEAVYLGKQNLLEEKKGEAFCYISTDGLVQDILIHIAKVKDDLQEKYTFKTDPFLGEFLFLDGFLRPEK